MIDPLFNDFTPLPCLYTDTMDWPSSNQSIFQQEDPKSDLTQVQDTRYHPRYNFSEQPKNQGLQYPLAASTDEKKAQWDLVMSIDTARMKVIRAHHKSKDNSLCLGCNRILATSWSPSTTDWASVSWTFPPHSLTSFASKHLGRKTQYQKTRETAIQHLQEPRLRTGRGEWYRVCANGRCFQDALQTNAYKSLFRDYEEIYDSLPESKKTRTKNGMATILTRQPVYVGCRCLRPWIGDFCSIGMPKESLECWEGVWKLWVSKKWLE